MLGSNTPPIVNTCYKLNLDTDDLMLLYCLVITLVITDPTCRRGRDPQQPHAARQAPVRDFEAGLGLRRGRSVVRMSGKNVGF